MWCCFITLISVSFWSYSSSTSVSSLQTSRHWLVFEDHKVCQTFLCAAHPHMWSMLVDIVQYPFLWFREAWKLWQLVRASMIIKMVCCDKNSSWFVRSTSAFSHHMLPVNFHVHHKQTMYSLMKPQCWPVIDVAPSAGTWKNKLQQHQY